VARRGINPARRAEARADAQSKPPEVQRLLSPRGWETYLLIVWPLEHDGRSVDDVARDLGISFARVLYRRNALLEPLRRIANMDLERCARCRELLPADAPRNRRYCRETSACRVAAKRKRDRDRAAAIAKAPARPRPRKQGLKGAEAWAVLLDRARATLSA
jgi:hypothetical protein